MIKKEKQKITGKKKLPILAKTLCGLLILISIPFIVLSIIFLLDFISLQEFPSLVFGLVLLIPSLIVIFLTILFLMKINWARMTLSSLLVFFCFYLLSIFIGSIIGRQGAYSLVSLVCLVVLGYISYYFSSNKKVKEAFS